MPKRTPLYDTHKQLGARMVPFGGWEMPVQYNSIREEHVAVRCRAGLFDISHMGEIILEGPEAFAAAQYLTCNDLKRLAPGKCQYSALLTPEGTFVDDIVVYPLRTDQILLCVNASNTVKDFQWIEDKLSANVRVRNESAKWCQLAVQGPKAEAIMSQLVGETARNLKRFSFSTAILAGTDILLSRTGYTGEDGFEIYGPSTQAEVLWQGVMEVGSEHDLVPCGLGARDTLRLEVNFPLYGHEIDDQTNPYEAGLGWIVRLDKGDFIGREALQSIHSQGIERKLIGFRMDDRSIPRKGYGLYLGNEEQGKVTSGSFSPSLQVGIGTGFVPTQHAEPNNKIAVDIRGKKRKATIIAAPFYSKNIKERSET